MNGSSQPITDHDLHAYVDGQLSGDRAAEVEAWLAQEPEAAARVQTWRTQNAALQALFDPVLEEPVPGRLMAPLTRRPLRPAWLAVAATVAGLVVGGGAGFELHAWLNPPAEVTLMAERAAVAHVVYAAEVLHPVEVTSEQERHLVQWLSKRLGRELRTPDFSGFGYQLIGGRLLPGDKGPAAQFMYQDPAGVRLTLYVSVPERPASETSFRYEEEAGTHVLYWVDRDLGFALVGDADRAHLMDFAHVAYQAFNF